jgi:hypothetical protein
VAFGSLLLEQFPPNWTPFGAENATKPKIEHAPMDLDRNTDGLDSSTGLPGVVAGLR